MRLLTQTKTKLTFKNPLWINGQMRTTREGHLLSFEKDQREVLLEIPYFPGLTSQEKEPFFSLEPNFIEALSNNKKNLVPNHPTYLFIWSYFQRYQTISLGQASCLYHNMVLASELSEQTCDESLIKVKIKQVSLKDDLQQISSFLKANPKIKIRIDANQSLSTAELSESWNILQPFKKQIEYFEEPCFKYQSNNLTEIPIALDEKAYRFANDRLDLPFSPVALVIKPSLWGEIDEIIDLKKREEQIVISSCFEHPVTLKALVYIASHFPETAHGLSTFKAYDDYSLFLDVDDFRLTNKKAFS